MITKKEIEKETKVTRLKGFSPRFNYFYQIGSFQFRHQTGRNFMEVWNDSPKNGEYPGEYFDAPQNKKDFIDFIYWYLNNNN